MLFQLKLQKCPPPLHLLVTHFQPLKPSHSGSLFHLPHHQKGGGDCMQYYLTLESSIMPSLTSDPNI